MTESTRDQKDSADLATCRMPFERLYRLHDTPIGEANVPPPLAFLCSK